MNSIHPENLSIRISFLVVICCVCCGLKIIAQPSSCEQSGLPVPSSSVFEMHPVDLNIPGIHKVKVIDLDLDGDLDIVGGSEQTPYSASVGLIWWRNDGGYPIVWTRFTIDGSFLHIMSVDAGFINDDPYPDVVASSWSNGKIGWWKNSGTPETGWIYNDVVSGWINPHDAVCHDIDDDGDTDVIGASSGNNRISVFKNPGGPVPVWQEEVVTSYFAGAKSVVVEDLDGDSLPDLVAAGDVCDDIAWWKNLGGNPILWQKKFITTNFTGAGGLDITDMNYDGQLDVLGSGWEGNEVSFWICNNIAANSWTKTMVTNQLDTVSGAFGSDIDLDGDKDIVAIGKIPGELAIFYRGDSTFAKDILYPEFSGGTALAVIDIDHDNDFDIIAGAGVLKKLFLFENKTINTSVPEHLNESLDLSPFPNPASQNFSVKLQEPDSSKIRIEMYNNLGYKVFSSYEYVCNGGITIHPPGIAKGIYLFQVFLDDQVFRGKVFIN